MGAEYVEFVNVVTIDEEYTHPERGVEVWHEIEHRTVWAVRPSSDQYKSWKDGEDEPADFHPYAKEGFLVNGGDAVRIWDKNDVATLRGLLDEIEKHLDK